MARQCIYCGRVLKDGETCDCRSRGTQKSDVPPTGSKTSEKKKQTGNARAKRTDFNKARARKNQARSSNGLLKSLLHRYAGFFRSPIDTAIAFSIDTRPASMLFLVVLEALAAALIAAIGARSSLFYLSFTMMGFTLQGAASAGTAALLAALQSFIRFALLSGILFAYLRLLLKRPISFRQTAALVAPAVVPTTLFMVLGSLSAAGAAPLAVLLLILGLMTGFVFLFFTLRNHLRIPDNQTLLVLLFAFLLYFSVLSMVTGRLSILG